MRPMGQTTRNTTRHKSTQAEPEPEPEPALWAHLGRNARQHTRSARNWKSITRQARQGREQAPDQSSPARRCRSRHTRARAQHSSHTAAPAPAPVPALIVWRVACAISAPIAWPRTGGFWRPLLDARERVLSGFYRGRRWGDLQVKLGNCFAFLWSRSYDQFGCYQSVL